MHSKSILRILAPMLVGVLATLMPFAIAAPVTAIASKPLISRLSDAEIHQRVTALIQQMTLEEKIHQLASAYMNGNRRLGIPNLTPGEALHGVCAGDATSFPGAPGLGATWDPDLIERIGKVIGQEGRALGYHQVFSPMLGLARDPRWGRVEESYGEDPYHVSRIGVAFIKGVQGTGADYLGPNQMACTPKHFVADGASLRGTNGEAVDISETTLRETALLPFEVAVKEARVASLMPAHHSLNRIPCHAHKWLLTDVLRNEWGFDGMVTSDMGDVAKNHVFAGEEGHFYARNYPEAGRMALEAGVDMELTGMSPWNSDHRCFGAQMVEYVKAGKVSMTAVDRAVSKVLQLKFRLGLFGPEVPRSYDPLLVEDKQQPDTTGLDPWAIAIREGKNPPSVPAIPRADAQAVLTDKAHEQLALEAAQKAITLLKNEGNLLPLDNSKVRKIAVVGPNAFDGVLGGYSGTPRYRVGVLQGLQNLVGKEVEVKYAQGCDVNTAREDGIAEAVAAAQAADVCIAVVGTTRDVMGENLDRSDLNLPGVQQKLVEAVYATGKPLVVVLINGGALTIPWIAKNVPAIVEGWYLGQEGGNAKAQVLFGDVNPGGKLPVTFPDNLGMVPCYYNQMPMGSPRIYLGGNGYYRVQYPFGHGLSYTTFSISPPQLNRSEMGANESAELTVTVKNTGQRAGDEVVQLYVTQRYGSLVAPVKQLKAFQRITLQPGESRELKFPIGFEQLKGWRNGKWMVEPAQYRLTVGPDSATGQTAVLEVK